jgi:hypothetical protein
MDPTNSRILRTFLVFIAGGVLLKVCRRGMAHAVAEGSENEQTFWLILWLISAIFSGMMLFSLEAT